MIKAYKIAKILYLYTKIKSWKFEFFQDFTILYI